METIGIVVAMDEELDAIKKVLNNKETKIINKVEYIVGTIWNNNCVILKSSIGKVNAARSTQIMIMEFKPKYIINIGIAGGINEDLKLKDVIRAKYVVQHDFDITAFEHKKGYISNIGDNIECDTDIVKELEKVLDKEYNLRSGIVATGDVFCTKKEMKEEILKEFNADVVDMECGAIAQVCYLEKIPFVAIKCISDIPNGNNVITFDENINVASKRCAEILSKFLKNWKEIYLYEWKN